MPTGPSRPRKRVLIVDDSAQAREHARGCLEDAFECLVAKNGTEGLTRAINEKPDGVLSDLEMPLLDGIGLRRALRANEETRSIPVILMTSVTDVKRVNECRAFGCAGFVLKPLEKDYVHSKIATLLRGA